jgi:ATP phosphoribosyltransferase regulatory subunit
LVEADRLLGPGGAEVQEHLATLNRLAAELGHRYPDVSLHFDLAELRGYHYHTGLVFGAYLPGHGDIVARGGRYDNIGAAFGRRRPATGFSADLKTLLMLGRFDSAAPPAAIFAPRSDDGSLTAAVDGLRARGERVICELPGQAVKLESLGCDRRLVQKAGDWVVEALDQTAANADS